MPNPVIAYIGLGANLGDAIGTLLNACDALRALAHTSHVCVSGFYCSAPIEADGPDYINAVASIKTTLPPQELLQQLFNIENTYGRERSYLNAPRTLDMDLLLYGDQHINTAELTVPHPRMHLRAFVLQPLAELNPHIKLPAGSIKELLQACTDQTIRPLDQG